MTLEDYRKKINEIIESKMDEIRQEIATDFAYAILYNDKYDVHHDYDPPWDYSGSVSRLDEKLNINNYDTFEDFLLEYNGNTRASFVSGCGFFHDSYEDEYLRTIYEKISEYHEDFIRKIFKNEEEKKNLFEVLNIEESTDDYFDIYDEYTEEILVETITEHDILERFKEEKAQDFFNEGVLLAKKMKAEEDKERERLILEMENKN